MSEEKLSPWAQYKKNLGETRVWDLIDGKSQRVPDADSNDRLEICKTCPEFFSLTHQCKKCGCLMDLKTKLAAASCPIGKWDAIEL